jgi:hypothetical protein
MPSLTIGSRLVTVKPFLYNPNVKYFTDTFQNLNNWTQTETGGTYSLTSEGLQVTAQNNGHITFVTTQNVVQNKQYFAVYAKVKVLSFNGAIELVGACDTIPSNNTIHLTTDSTQGLQLRVGSSTISSSPKVSVTLPLNEFFEVLMIYSNGTFSFFIKRSTDTDWIPAFDYENTSLVPYMLKLWIGAHNYASVVYNTIIVYEPAGTGIKDIRPIIDGATRRILTDGTYYYFWATEGYYGGSAGGGSRDRICILRTTDFTNFELVKSVTIKEPGYTGQGYAIKIGDRIYVWMMNWKGAAPYQGGLHRICQAVLDSQFNYVTLYEDVTLQNAPAVSNIYDIWLIYVNNAWYAITIGFSAGGHVWSLSDPTSRTLTFVKQIFGTSPRRENATAYVVTDGTNMYILLSDNNYDNGVDEFHLFDLNFNFIQTLATLSWSGYCGGVTFVLTSTVKRIYHHDKYLSYWNLLNSDGGFVLSVYDCSSDLTIADFARKPTSLTLTVTPL